MAQCNRAAANIDLLFRNFGEFDASECLRSERLVNFKKVDIAQRELCLLKHFGDCIGWRDK